MKYFLRMTDLSGRGFKALHEYPTEEERVEDFKKIVGDDVPDDDEGEEELDDMIATLERGGIVECEATEYEFIDQA